MENKGATFGVDQKELGITIGGFKAHVGIDTGSTIDGNMVAHVGQQAEDVMGDMTGRIADVNMSSFQAHDKEHIGFSFTSDMGEIALNYAPSNSTSNAANSVSDAGASATEVVFSGSLGVPGLAVKIGQQDTATANGSGSDEKEKFYGATYQFGKAKVGYSNRSFDVDGVTTELDGSDSYSLAYAISDNLSVAVERLNTKKKGTANKEELTLLGLSYNLGGLGIEAYYGTAQDLGGVAGADGDAVQLRTVFAY
jgi:predicted porin